MIKKQKRSDFKTITGIKPGKNAGLNTAAKLHHETAETGIKLFFEKAKSASLPAINHTGSKSSSGLDIKKGNLQDNSSPQKTYNTKKDFKSVYITKK